MASQGFEGNRKKAGEMAIDGETMCAGTGVSAATLSAPGEHRALRSVSSDLLESLPGPSFGAAKRGFDIVASAVGLLIFGALLPILALAIKLDSPGSVFYAQERVGMDRRRRRHGATGAHERRKVLQPGRPFRIYKLRTMCANAEVGGPQWAQKDDKRVTRVGRFLRKTRLDELPQLWNVLRGEMSLIGPRPERLCFIRQLENEIPFYHDRLLVKPGLTGLAQVRNGYDDSLESVIRKVELDRQYIQRCGPLTEAGILLETVRVVLKGEGAR